MDKKEKALSIEKGITKKVKRQKKKLAFLESQVKNQLIKVEETIKIMKKAEDEKKKMEEEKKEI